MSSTDPSSTEILGPYMLQLRDAIQQCHYSEFSGRVLYQQDVFNCHINLKGMFCAQKISILVKPAMFLRISL